MPGIYQAQVRLAADNSLPADAAVNTFHFEVLDNPLLTDSDIITGQRDGGLDENGIHGDLSDLYDTLSPFYSQAVDWASSTIKWTNLSDPVPRVPLMELPIDPVPDGASGGLPAEVALCASFAADVTSGVVPASRRNRVYLGPLNPTVLNVGGLSGRPTPAFMNAIVLAFANLASNSDNEPQWRWSVYSPTYDSYTAVDYGWVDDAFDTQRRRGPEPTSRTNWRQNA